MPEWIPIGDLVTDDINRQGPSGPEDFTYVDIGSVDRDSKLIIDPKSLPVEKAPSRAKQVLKSGDVLVSMTRPNLNAVAIVPPKLDGSIGSTGFHVLRASHADPSFLFYAVQTRDFVEAMCLKVQGALYPAVRPNDISAYRLPLFSLAEQRRIVAKIEELFSELDAGEKSLRRARRQLGVYRQSLLKQAFEGKLTAHWRKQNPGLLETPEQLLERSQEKWKASKDSETTSRDSRKRGTEVALDSQLVESLPQLPEFWRWTALGNLTELITKGSSPKWQGFDYTSDASGVLFVTSENVRSGFLDLTRPKYLGLGFNKVQAKSILRDGDVLLNIVGASIGRAAVFQGNAVANINQAVALIRLSDFLNRVFLTHHLNSSRTYALITSKAVDVARANFSLADVNEIPVPLCSLPEQREIVRLLDEQFTVIEQNEREIDAALKRSAALRQSILKKAFTGQLVPQDPTDEPASALLERIRKAREVGAANAPRKKTTRKANPAP